MKPVRGLAKGSAHLWRFKHQSPQMTTSPKQGRSGFTLIELAIVIVIIGIVISILATVLPALIQTSKIKKAKAILDRRSYFFPVVIFPSHEQSHTAAIIGWKNRRPRALEDVKAAFAGRVWLTAGHLQGHSLLLGRLVSFTIPLEAINSVKISHHDAGLLEVRFRQAEKSGLLRFMTKGAPEGVVLLKLDEAAGRWLRALQERLQTGSAGG